jgi:hypothetical protein
MSTRSSRKRAREVVWAEVFTDVVIPSDEGITPDHFNTMTASQQTKFLHRYNMKDNLEYVQRRVAECLSLKPIPSPSNMKWSNISSILESKCEKNIQALEAATLPEVKLDAITIMQILHRKFKNKSEMDVVIRIFSLILCVIADLPAITVTLQPTEFGHSDFLIKIENGSSITRLIEVKRTTVMVDMSKEVDETAQALREVHILLQNTRDCNTASFLLTNGTVFSFAIVSKTETSKIQLDAVTTILCNLECSKGWQDAMRHIRAYITGNWPTLASIMPLE